MYLGINSFKCIYETLTRNTLNILARSKMSIPIALVAKLRKAVPVSLLRAKEALSKNDGNLEMAIAWLEKEALSNGLAKASKVSDRVAAQGLIALTLDPNRRKGSLIQVNCETDFVSRSPLFADLCTKLGNSHLWYESMDINAPILPLNDRNSILSDKVVSCEEAILSKVGELGEKIMLGQTCLSKISTSKGIIGGYIHAYSGSNSQFLGRIGGLVSLNYDSNSVLNQDQMANLVDLADKIAKHIVGFNPSTILPSKDSSDALMSQEFLSGGGVVEAVLAKESKILKVDRLWVSDFKRMEVGQGIDKVQDNFAEQVQQQVRASV